MRCSTFRKRIVAFADGELPDDMARQMAAHAVTCASCAEELATVRQEAARYAGALYRQKAPPDLVGNVMAAIADKQPQPTGLRAWLQPTIPLRWASAMAGAAAVGALMLLGTANVIRQTGTRAAGPAATPTLHFAGGQPVQAEGYLAHPSGGKVYVYGDRRAAAKASSPGTRPYWSVSYVANPIQQAEPAFEVEEMGEEGASSKAAISNWNEELGRPRAVTEAEQRTLNAVTRAEPAEPGAPYLTPGGSPGSPGMSAIGPLAAEAPPTPLPPAVSVESTDASVVLTVSYRRDEEQYTTLYQADFAADYIIRAPDVKRKGVRIAVTFPFPNGCTTVSGSKLTVDGKEDEDHTAYSIAGIRWVGWFEPKATKTIAIAYSARGEGNYRYALDKDRLAKKFRLLMRIEGLEPGHEAEIPGDSLQPAVPGPGIPGKWDYVWDHERLLTTKDIAVNFPTKASPTASANRVMQTVSGLLWIARYAPLFLVLYLAALGLSGLWNPSDPFRLEELGLLGVAFLLFYPLFLFGAAYFGESAALWSAALIVVIMSAAYASVVRGPSFAIRVGLLLAILLGACTHALLDRATSGLIFTAGALVLLGYFMALHARRGRGIPPTA